MSTSEVSSLPFTRDSEIFRAFQELWAGELGQKLSFEDAERYGPKILALVGAVARAKRNRWL